MLALVYSGFLLSGSIQLSTALMAINGLLAGQCAFSFVYASSFLEEKHVAILSTLFMTIDGLTVGL